MQTELSWKVSHALQPGLRNHETKVVRAEAEASNLDELEAHFDAAFHVFWTFGPAERTLHAQAPLKPKTLVTALRSSAPGLAQASFFHLGKERKFVSWLAACQPLLKRTIAFGLSCGVPLTL